MSVSVYWILFALCSVRVCVHVFVCSLRPSSAVWSGVQMAELGPAEGDIRCSPFLCPCFLSSLIFSSPLPPIFFFYWVSFTSYIPGCLPSFITASAEGHLGQRRVFRSLFFPPLRLYVPLRAQCGSYTRWLWNEMSLNRAMCPGATVIAGEIQLPL